ncbi:MAG: tRNA lysidine(34) synthetase TilS [Ruminococcus sp.]|nr:tRNA lysidine(34) synthetase TilS [Ruminococcus sp.]
MKHKMLKAMADFSMLGAFDKVIVALSGGADSIALLHALNSIKEKYNLTLYACHLNHMIRGDEADADENFVREVCNNMNVELYCKRVDVPEISKNTKLSLELCGRNARYEYFFELSEKLNAKIATAHTASDNLETVLFNITRGTSLKGLSGIRPTRDNIIRPLIYVSREEVESYCAENSLSFVTDSTNLTDDYTRNNIRHNVVSKLKEINPDINNTVSRMCSGITDIKAYIDKISLKEINECKTEYGYSSEKLLQLDRAILVNSLFMISKKSGAEVSFCHVDMILDAMKSNGCVDLPGNKRAVCKQGILRIVDLSEKITDTEIRFKDSGFVKFISKEEIKNINKKLLKDCIDCDIITENTMIRTKREGDTFTFFERGVTKSLKKLLNELKIPAEKRSQLLLVANGSTVLWLQGVGVSKHGRINKDSNGGYLIG